MPAWFSNSNNGRCFESINQSIIHLVFYNSGLITWLMQEGKKTLSGVPLHPVVYCHPQKTLMIPGGLKHRIGSKSLPAGNAAENKRCRHPDATAVKYKAENKKTMNILFSLNDGEASKVI